MMVQRVLLVLSFLIGIPALADTPKLEGDPFPANVPITWAVTNSLPQTFVIYKTVPQVFSKSVISNAMALGSFKQKDRIRSKDKTLVEFRNSGGPSGWRLHLRIRNEPGWIAFQKNTFNPRPKNVPTVEEADRLAFDYFIRFGGDTNQIHERMRLSGEIETYDKPGGKKLYGGFTQRSVTFFRKISGIEISGSFYIEFGENSEVLSMEMDWRNYLPDHTRRTASPKEILQRIKNGKAVRLDFSGNSVPPIKSLKVTRIIPVYHVDDEYKNGAFVYPFGSVDMVALTKDNQTANISVHCPILEER